MNPYNLTTEKSRILAAITQNKSNMFSCKILKTDDVNIQVHYKTQTCKNKVQQLKFVVNPCTSGGEEENVT